MESSALIAADKSVWSCCSDIIRSRLVPKAVSWYTGEEADEDSDDEYGDEEDEEDDDDEDDEVRQITMSALALATNGQLNWAVKG